MNSLVTQLCEYLDASPTPYHAVENTKKTLEDAGFVALKEQDRWDLKPAGRYYIERRNASIIAFKIGVEDATASGLRIIGAHTDSPTLKAKPCPDLNNHSYGQIGVEVYGGALLNPWFDRDLSLAGRVTFSFEGKLQHTLVNFKRPIAIIPSLAIHLDRTANAGREVNPQTQMRPILCQGQGDFSLRSLIKEELARLGLVLADSDILEHDLCFYDTQPAACVGLNEEFIASARLDNLLSCFLGLQALLGSDDKTTQVLALYDHEEVGSLSDVGANSNMLPVLLERLYPDVETRHRVISNSYLLSTDNAHGIHPNFAGKHDESHAPKLNEGPVIKVDANQGYATSSETAGLVSWLAQQAGVPVQRYVTRADMRCGGTIGPMTAAKTGVKTVDLGLPTFAMHSVRELSGTKDAKHMYELLKTYLNTRSFSF